MAVTLPTGSAPALEDFERVLARHDSATVALTEWCEMRGMARPARITARRLNAHDTVSPEMIRRQLGLAPDEAFAMRNVELRCGSHVLSVAWNWYVPSRLTPSMNDALRLSDTPFGKVVAPLRFRRQPMSTVSGAARICPAGTISTHQAMLTLPDGRPLAFLVECYTAANLQPIAR